MGIPVAAFVLASLLTGCGPFGTGGALGNGGFTYDCTSDGDAFCEGSVPLLPGFTSLPAGIAVGGTFNILYNGEQPKTNDGIEFQVIVVPASTKLVDAVSGGFRVTSAGETAFLARGANGVVADFVQVHVADTDHLEISAAGATLTKLDLTTSTQENLRVEPLDVNNSTLAGGLEYMWASSDENIVSVGSSNANDATVQGVAAGMATISVSLGTIKLDLPVTVSMP